MSIGPSLPARTAPRPRSDEIPLAPLIQTVPRDEQGSDAARTTDSHGPTIEGLRAAAYTIPTDRPESDGTLSWDRTTLIVVELAAGRFTGLGYGYADASAADIAARVLAPPV